MRILRWFVAFLLGLGLLLVIPDRSRSKDIPSIQAASTIYYVAPHGSNANPGTREAPWATPGYGSRQLHPDDTLIILGGRYVLSQYDEDIITPPSGTANAWVTIKGEDGRRPILVGRDDLAMAVNLGGASYVRLENLEITHDSQASGAGVYFRDGVVIMDGPASHIVLQDLYIHHIDEFGVNIQDVNDLQVNNCGLEYCGFGAMGGPEQQQGGWRNVRIQGCRLSYGGHYYQGGDGSNRPYDRPDGFGIEPSNGPIEIVDTIAEHNYGDGLDSKAANTTIRRCIVANNSCDGVKLWGDNSRVENTLIYGRGDGSSEITPWSPIVIHTEQANARFALVNVTVDDALGHNYLMHVQYDTPNIPLNITIKNTIWRGAAENSPIFIGQATVLQADHNLFYMPNTDHVLEHGSTTYTAGNIASLGSGNRYGDPRFVAPAWGQDGDYHLQAGSPAINAGTTTGAPSDDLEGRPRDAQPDIGAYEYGAAAATPTPTQGATRFIVRLPLILKGPRLPQPTATPTHQASPTRTSTFTRTPTGTLTPRVMATPTRTPTGTSGLQYPPGFTFVEVPEPLSGENPTYPLLSMSVPAVGGSFFDPRFGTICTRVTETDGIRGRHEYSRFDPFNADKSLILLLGDFFSVYRPQPLPYNRPDNLVRDINLEELRWDPHDPNLIWGTEGFTIKTLNVATGQTTLIKDFAQDPTIGPLIAQENSGQERVYRITMKDEGESSLDKRFWAFFLQGNAFYDYALRYIFSWDKNADAVLGVYEIGANERELDWVSMSPLGNWVLIGGLDYNGGNLVGLTMANKQLTQFHRLDFSTAHADVGLDTQGREVIVMQNVRTDYIDLIPIDLSTRPILEAGGSYAGTNRTPLVRLFYASDSPYGLQGGVHISCNVSGYCLVSTNIEPGLPEQNWLDRTSILVRLDRSHPRAFYLAKNYGTTGAYWEETHGTISNDGSRILWATNWSQNVGQEQVFLLELTMPTNWRQLTGGQ